MAKGCSSKERKWWKESCIIGKGERKMKNAEIWVNKIDYLPHEFSKLHMMNGIKIITSSDTQDKCI